jgi:hypothetical protein
MVAIMNWLIATEFCLKDDWGSVYTVIIFVWYFSAFVIFTDTPPSVARHYPHVFDRFAFLFSFFMSLFYFVPRVYLTILIHVCFSFFLSISSYFTASIFYCQTNTDNGSDRSYNFTRYSHFFLLSMSF